MERGSQWITYHQYRASLDSWMSTLDNANTDSFTEDVEEETKTLVLVNSILPDDLLERILAHLPIAGIFRAGGVCKKWHEMVSSRRFLWSCSGVQPHKPWYFMFTGSEDGIGYAYDPTLRKWHGIDLPAFVTSSWCISSSRGLVCFMNTDTRSKIQVCNVVTKSCKKLIDPPGPKNSDYSALAISVNMISRGYTIYVVKSKQIPEDPYQWEVSIHKYDSATMAWTTLLTELLTGWRAGAESVICGADLYFMIYSTQISLQDDLRHGLIRYNLLSQLPQNLLMSSFIRAPCALTCGRLMNLKEKLVMVGGIGKQDRSDIIKGIGIWVLNENEWQELARMPHKLLQGFGELDDVFASGGAEDLIYIHSYGGPALVAFDMNNKQFKWSHKCPVSKKFPLQLFDGFCFEPRLGIDP